MLNKIGTVVVGIVFFWALFFVVLPKALDQPAVSQSFEPAPAISASNDSVQRPVIASVFEPFRNSLPTDFSNVTLAVTYGRPRSAGKWGSLGSANTAKEAIDITLAYAGIVDAWNGSKGVVPVVNPNVDFDGARDKQFVTELIEEARKAGIYVMLDVQTGILDPIKTFRALEDMYLADNVWFDWDLEHVTSGTADVAVINAIASEYFSAREKKGLSSPGLFAIYVVYTNRVKNPRSLVTEYPNGYAVPIFDGHATASKDVKDPKAVKIAATRAFIYAFGADRYGIMEFESKWGKQYDEIGAREYFNLFSNAFILARQ